jgi:hypothetical protein
MRNRFSPQNPELPIRKFAWKGDERSGELELVVLERGWPAEWEEITHKEADLAITHRRRDILARYLRQPNPARHIILRLADLLDRSAKGSAEADRLAFEGRGGNRHPVRRLQMQRAREQVGSEIRALIESGYSAKEAQLAIEEKYPGIKRSTFFRNKKSAT